MEVQHCRVYIHLVIYEHFLSRLEEQIRSIYQLHCSAMIEITFIQHRQIACLDVIRI